MQILHSRLAISPHPSLADAAATLAPFGPADTDMERRLLEDGKSDEDSGAGDPVMDARL